MQKTFIIATYTLLVIFGLSACVDKQAKYEPTWESVEKVNPAPEWFKDAKFGIYFHWGVYSVPAYINEWYPRNMYDENSHEYVHHTKTYGSPKEWPYHNFIQGAKNKKGEFMQFAPKLKSEGGKFDPQEWAQLFANSGAKYAGPVAEHHDGFSMWASKVNPWNAKDMGPKLDLVKLLTDAIRANDMKIILSMHHAYNINGFYEYVEKQDNPDLQMLYGQMGKKKNEEVWLAKHKEVIDAFQPDILWQDITLPEISDSINLSFLSYYYNKADEWGKEVVATYKDAYNKKCAMLDYERGGPEYLTDYYWLTDDAISRTSWCYTEGINYYSNKQVMHGFFDRISKNGNLLLNISPKADGSIPQEQKDILLAMGDWLKKYGEAIYKTRAWTRYGEGPTKMGARHGVFTAPSEGTAKDFRFTRSKDNTTLYAIMLDWPEAGTEADIKTLSSNRIDLKSLKSVEMIGANQGEYISLNYEQSSTGLTIQLPEKHTEELAYVLKFTFNEQIPDLNTFIEVDESRHYNIAPANNKELLLGGNVQLSGDLNSKENQWGITAVGNGIFKIENRVNPNMVLECTESNDKNINVQISQYTERINQHWKIEDTFGGVVTITNYEYVNYSLAVGGDKDNQKVSMKKEDNAKGDKWNLVPVCNLEQTPFKANGIPGTIEMEDFDNGCSYESFFIKDDTHESDYRPSYRVGIQDCMNGGFNIGWISRGDWLEYTVTVKESGEYKLEMHVAQGNSDDVRAFHLEFGGIDKTGQVNVSFTGGYQKWGVVSKTVNLTAGEQIMRLCFDKTKGLNIDKLVFKLIN